MTTTVAGKLELRDLQRLMDDATRRNTRTGGRPPLDLTTHPAKTVGVLVVSDLALLLLLRYLRQNNAGSLVLGLALIMIVLFGVLTLITVAAIWFRYATPRQLAKQPGVLGPRSYALEADGLRVTTETSDAVTQFDDITEVRVDADYIFIYMGKLVGPVIPRRFFDAGGDEAFEAFAAALSEHSSAAE